MKKLALLALPLLLVACGNPPGQTSGNRVSVGVSVTDAASQEVATKTVKAATETEPATVSWAIAEGQGVTFTFMTRPGSDAVYLTGYRILRESVTAGGTTNTTTEPSADRNKMDLYLTSGYTCAARTALRSCDYGAADTVPANGVPGQHSIYLEGGLGSLVAATDGGVTQVTDIEFYGVSSNGEPVTVKASGIVSRGIKQESGS